MSQEEDVLSLEDSDSEYFDTAEACSSADEMDDCLSVVSEVEGLTVAEATGPKISKVPAGAEAPGSDELMESPGWPGARKIRVEAGMGLAGQSAVNGRPSVVKNSRGVCAWGGRRGTGIIRELLRCGVSHGGMWGVGH